MSSSSDKGLVVERTTWGGDVVFTRGSTWLVFEAADGVKVDWNSVKIKKICIVQALFLNTF